MAVRAFWPAGEAAQADYEMLRAAALAGVESASVVAARFERRGLAGVIAWPSSEPILTATVVGASRPPWTPHADPRVGALGAAFELLLAAPVDIAVYAKEAHR